MTTYLMLGGIITILVVAGLIDWYKQENGGRNGMLEEQGHEYLMKTDSDYFEEHSKWLYKFLEARENLIVELHKYNLNYKPEDFL